MQAFCLDKKVCLMIIFNCSDNLQVMRVRKYTFTHMVHPLFFFLFKTHCIRNFDVLSTSDFVRLDETSDAYIGTYLSFIYQALTLFTPALAHTAHNTPYVFMFTVFITLTIN